MNQSGNSTDPNEDLQTNREDRRLIEAVAVLFKLEQQIPQCRTWDEVEAIRFWCQGIIQAAPSEFGERIVAWAKRVALKCQLQLNRIQQAAKAAGATNLATFKLKADPELKSEVASPSNFTPKDPARRSDTKLVASLSEEELNGYLRKGGYNVQTIARKVRKERRATRKPKSSPEQLKAARDRYYKNKAAKRGQPETQEQKPKDRYEMTCEKFRRYWTQEQKLLGQFFNTKDFEKLEALWVREYQSYRKEVEAAEQERARALARLKQKTTGRVGGQPT